MHKLNFPQKRPSKKTSHPREHWTRKKNQWKQKKAFPSLEDAEKFITLHKMVNYYAYECPYCGCIHIGYLKPKKE